MLNMLVGCGDLGYDSYEGDIRLVGENSFPRMIPTLITTKVNPENWFLGSEIPIILQKALLSRIIVINCEKIDHLTNFQESLWIKKEVLEEISSIKIPEEVPNPSQDQWIKFLWSYLMDKRN